MSYDILARTNLGLHGQKCGIIMVDKITSNLNMHLCFILHFDQKLRILTLSRTLCYLDCGNPIYSGPYLRRQNVLAKLPFIDPKFRRSCLVSSLNMLPRLNVFPVPKQQVLLHLFSFLPEAAEHHIVS